MPRANRYSVPGHIWYITHRCLGKFVPIVLVVQSLRFVQDVDEDNIVEISREIGMCDRCRYLHWIFEAKKRFGLSVLNYMISHGASRGSCNPTFPLVEQRSPCLLAMIAFLRSIYSTG